MKKIVPTRIKQRIIRGIKNFQPILNTAKMKDSNEANTVVIIRSILADLFGYDRFSEISSELPIKGTFCDLAIIINENIRMLIKAKAIGIDLKSNHITQVVDYAANKGVDWVILTNGIRWIIFKIIFKKPIDSEQIFEFNILSSDYKDQDELQHLYMISKEGLEHSAIDNYYIQKKALDRYLISAAILSMPILKLIKKVLRHVSPDVKIDLSQIKSVLTDEVLKREVLEGERAEKANKKIQHCTHIHLKNENIKSIIPVNEKLSVNEISTEQIKQA